MSDSPDIQLERSLYYGLVFMYICYGFEIYMFSHSLRLWLRSGASLRGQRLAYIVIGALSLALTTVVVFTDCVFMEFMWIEQRDFPGGPLGYLAANSSIWWQTLGTACNQVTNFLGDGLLIYRCYIIWQANIWVVVFPILIYLASIAMAMVMLVQSALPGSNFFKGKTVNFGVPWASLSVSLNILCTSLIIFQLLRSRNQLKRHLPSEALKTYTGVSAILIESALPFSVLGIIFAVTYGKNMYLGPAFLFVWATFCALSPQFIIFRVTGGRSWTQDFVTQAQNSTVAFRPGQASMTLADSKASHKGTTLYEDSVNGSKSKVDHEMEFITDGKVAV